MFRAMPEKPSLWVWAATAIPGFMILAAISFQPVKVCAGDGQIQKSGLFVGETDDRIYVGETEPDSTGARRPLTIRLTKWIRSSSEREPQGQRAMSRVTRPQADNAAISGVWWRLKGFSQHRDRSTSLY
jgi:hypothetical protein